MELALAVHDVKQLFLLENMHDDEKLSQIEQETIQLVEQNVAREFQVTKPNRIYFGSEFCQYRIAPLEEVQTAFYAVEEKGLAFTYVTPYVPETGMKMLFPILQWLHEQEATSEVVVNDWGDVLCDFHEISEFENCSRTIIK